MSAYTTGFATLNSEVSYDTNTDSTCVPVKHEEPTYVFRDAGQAQPLNPLHSREHVTRNQTDLLSPTSSSNLLDSRQHYFSSFTGMSDGKNISHSPTLQTNFVAYGNAHPHPLLSTQASDQGEGSYPQAQDFSQSSQTPAAAFNAPFPPPPVVSVNLSNQTASSSRSSSAASYRYRPYSRASGSSVGDHSTPSTPNSFNTPGPSSNFQSSFSGISYHQSPSNYSSAQQTHADSNISQEINSSLSGHYVNSRIHSSNPILSTPTEPTATQAFNPALTAVPPSGLPAWPGASIPRSRAKQKHPRLSRPYSVDYLLGADTSSESQTSYAQSNPRPSYLSAPAAHALVTPHISPRHSVTIPGNFPAKNLNLFSGSELKTERSFVTDLTTAQLYTFNNMYHADGDLDTLEEYEEDDIMAGLQDGSPSSYLPHGDYMSGASGGAESGGKKDEKQVRRRSSKACDQCRKSKCKCERTSEGEPCRSCILLGTQCTFLGPSRKRGPPKGYIDAIESRLHQTEALVGIILALANPARSVTDEEDPKPDERARSLLEDLRNMDPLAREIIERVDRGAYGTKGRRGSSPFVSTKVPFRAGSGSGDEKSPTSPGAAREGEKGKSGSTGPPPSVHGRGRMVSLGQEIESGALASAHPSNEWQDTVTERLKAAQRSREGGAYGSKAISSGHVQHTSRERDRQRRRVSSANGAPIPQDGGPTRSPERAIQPRPTPQSTSHSSVMYSSLPALTIPSVSPPISAYVSPVATRSGGNATSTESEEAEDVEEGITDGVGQLSINEEAQVRFHGKASGLHLLGSKIRMDGRNRGGVWHFPKARVWPPVARMSAADIARQCEIESLERAAIARLPPREVQEQLLDLYFAHVHIFLPIVDKESFMAAFRAMMDEQEKAKGSPDIRDRTSIPRGRSGSERPGAVPMDRASSKARSITAETEGSERSVESLPTRRVPVLLLLAMFAISARFSPVAESTTLGTSPYHVAKEALFSSPGTASSTIHDLVTSVNEEQAAAASASNASVSSEKSLGKAGSTTSGEGEGAAPSGSDVDPDEALPMPQSGHMWAAGDGYLERAKEILDKMYATSRPSTCQALLLMGYREIGIGSMASSWLYIGMAVRMAQDLGMHRNSDHWSYGDEPLFSPTEQQVRKRIWYACVIMDKYVSTYIGRPLSIFEGDYDTPLPNVDAKEETEFWNLDSSMPNSMLTDPIEIALAPNAPFKPVPSRVLSCFNESARLASILASILHTIYAVKPTAGRHEGAMQLERILDKWFMDLPAPLRYDTGVKKGSVPSPNVLTLHMQYWCAVLLLHRPFIRNYVSLRRKRAANPESPVDHDAFAATQKNFDLCVAAANHITSLVSVYQDNHCLKRCAVFLSYYIFTAAIMHMTILATNHNDPQASLGLSKCMDVLKRIEIVWPSAGRAWELLNGAKDDLPEHEIPFPSFDRVKKRSADDPLSLEDTAFLHLSRETAPTNGNSPHTYSAGTNTGTNSHRFGHGPLLDLPSSGGEGSSDSSPLALFAYNRWSPDNTLAFPSASLSTSVLPQQYSTGFVEDRHHAAPSLGSRRSTASSTVVNDEMNINGGGGSGGRSDHARSPYAHEHGHTNHHGHGHGHAPSSGTSGRGHLQYWSDFSMGTPASMLGSMYGMAVLNPHGGHGSSPTQSGSNPGSGSVPQQPSPHSPHEFNNHPPFIGEPYNVFGH